MPFVRSPREWFYDPEWAADLLRAYTHGDANGEYSSHASARAFCRSGTTW